jgi:putative ABC transport system permease protein
MFTNVWFDTQYAWRLIFKDVGHSVLCAVVVALSIGLAIFTYEGAYNMALKPLPYPGSERWLSLQVAADATATPQAQLDAYTYQELLKRTRTIDHLGAFSSRAAVLSEGQASASLRASDISPKLLAAMKAAPQMGRLFDAADGEPGAAPAVILSFAAWRSYFAADPHIIGRQTRIDGRPMQIVGVMPRTFYAFQDFELWFPLQMKALANPGDSSRSLSPLILLAKDQDPDAVLNEMKPAVEAVNRNYPALFNAARHLEVFAAHRISTPHSYLQIVAINGFLALAVLLLGCMNISMIFLARLLERSRELALRSALGASRGRLLRLCLLESVFVVLLGLLVGISLAALAIHWTHSIVDFHVQIQATGHPPDLMELRLGDLVAAVIAAVSIWLLSTLTPAWHIAKQDASEALAGSGKGVSGPGRAKGARLLVGLQVIVSCLLLVICGNVVSTVNSELAEPTGLDMSHVMLSTSPTIFDARYAEAPQRLRYWDELTAAINSRMPGAEIAYATATPTEPIKVPAAIEHQEGSAGKGTLKLPLAVVSDKYFELLGIRLRAGRLFDSTDSSSSLGVAVIDENTAKRYWPNQDVLGKRIQLNPADNGPRLTIVGVVSGVGGLYTHTTGLLYQSLRQAVPDQFQLLVKLPPSAADSRAELRSAVFAVDRDLPLHNLQMLEDFLQAEDLDDKSLIPVFSVIAAITAILAATGLFGLISRSVARRTQEVGVRRALGSTQWQVTALFLRQGAFYLSIGVVGGCLGVLATNVLSSAVPNVMNHVAPVAAGVFVLMSVVILVACTLPTRRAVSLEPGDALHYE